MEGQETRRLEEPSPPKAIVCLYAQRDEPMYRELQNYLVLWQKQGRIYWADSTAVEQADLVLLLVSPSFFATNSCHTAMVRAMEVQAERSVPVVPLLARASDWKESDCGGLQALPNNELPIAEWEQPERAYENICAGLARILPDLPALGRAPQEGVNLFQAPKLPKSYVARPKEVAAAKRLLLQQQRTQATAITTALRGAGGFGKTTLALVLCHDREIQAAFPDGILWVELGEQHRRPLDVLNTILASLEPSQTEAITLEEAKRRWRSALQERVCLLVIDDVWQAETLLPLLEGGPKCVRLITTRNDLLLPKDTARILVDAMEAHEAVAVLCQGLPEAISQATFQPNLEALATRLGCWPLLLALANGLLTDLVDAQMSLSGALATVTQAYETRGVTAFRQDNVEERQRTVDACLGVSLQHLETFTQAHYHALERYQELAVFPEDTDIPLSTLQIYWKESAGLELWETKDLCLRLYRLSLLLTCDLGTGTIRLHDVLRSYLIQCVGEQLPVLHQRLLDAHRQHYHLTRWADLTQRNVYVWQQLIFHLREAGNREAFQATLTDLLYLTRKVVYVGVSALEADLAWAVVPSPRSVEEYSLLPVEQLHQIIRQNGHLFYQVANEAEVGGLLLSHLYDEAGWDRQRQALEHELPRPFFTAWHALPQSSSPALVRTLYNADRVSACGFSPDGKWIVSAGGMLKMWEVDTGAEVRTLSDVGRACGFSPDSKKIVSTYGDKLEVWDCTTGAKLLTFTGHTSFVSACGFSPDGKQIVSASRNETPPVWGRTSKSGTLKVWDSTTGAERLTITSHTSFISACGFSPDGRWIVSASWDGTLKLWEAVTGAELLTLPGHPDRIWACAFSPAAKQIVSASQDGTLKLWDCTTGVELLTFSGHTDSVNACGFSPDGRWIVSASEDNTLKVWDSTTGAELLTFSGHTDSVNACGFSPDGKLIVSASDDETLKLWDRTTGEKYLTLTGHTSQVLACGFSPSGQQIVFASLTELKVWDSSTGAERLALTGHTSVVTACGYSPDGRWIVSASWDGTIKLWEAATGEEYLTFSGHTDRIWACAFSPAAKQIVSASQDETLKLWDCSTGEERITLTGHTDFVSACGYSPDGRWIVSGSWDTTLKVWDVFTGREHLTLTGHTGWVNACKFSPDGKQIVSASEDETLKLWNSATGEEQLTLTGHTGRVCDCEFSPNGQWIVSASADHTLKVWETQNGQCVLTYPVDGELWSCAFHPDGEHLATGGNGGLYLLRLAQ